MENQAAEVNRIAGKVIFSFLGGALVGALLAYLYAPRSGQETRDQWRDSVRRGREKLGTLPAAFKEASGAAKAAFQRSPEEHPSH